MNKIDKIGPGKSEAHKLRKPSGSGTVSGILGKSVMGRSKTESLLRTVRNWSYSIPEEYNPKEMR